LNCQSFKYPIRISGKFPGSLEEEVISIINPHFSRRWPVWATHCMCFCNIHGPSASPYSSREMRIKRLWVKATGCTSSKTHSRL
jgi:hypothetical protein